MNLDLAKVLVEPESRRMQTLWSLMPIDLRGVPRSIIFHPGLRLREQGYRWAPATLLRPTTFGNSIFRENGEADDSIGVPTANGLIVSLPGFVILPSKAPRGLPENVWNIHGGFKGDSLYAKDNDSAWYKLADMTERAIHSRKLILEADSASRSSQSHNNDQRSPDHADSERPMGAGEQTPVTQHPTLSDLIRNESKDYCVLMHTKFEAADDGLQQERVALLVKWVRDEDGVKYAQTELRAGIALLGKSMSEMVEAAYQCGQCLKQNECTQRLAQMFEDSIDTRNPAYNEELNKLRQQIREQATKALQNADLMKTVSVINGVENANLSFQELLTQFFMGLHGFVGAKYPSTQRWCVD